MTYEVLDYNLNVMTGSALTDLVIRESFPVETGNLSLSRQTGTWRVGDVGNSLNPANGRFTDELSAGGLLLGSTSSGEALQVFSAQRLGTFGVSDPLMVLGFSSPTTVLHNVYQPNMVTINGTVAPSRCSR